MSQIVPAIGGYKGQLPRTSRLALVLFDGFSSLGVRALWIIHVVPQ